jgi:hypothetical protein
MTTKQVKASWYGGGVTRHTVPVNENSREYLLRIGYPRASVNRCLLREVVDGRVRTVLPLK